MKKTSVPASNRSQQQADCPVEPRPVAREALGLDPTHAKAIRLLAHVQRRRGELPAARDLLLQQLRRSPGTEDWRLRYELAAVLDRLGEYDEAMRELILAKEQLRSFASRFVEEARAVRARQLEIAQQLTKSALATWAAAINAVRDPMRLAILCGHPRSGTTLLEQLLAAHPEVISTDETSVWQREFLDPIIREAPSAADVVRELSGFDAGQLGAGRRSYLRFTEAHLGQAIGHRVLIEKDPSLTPDLPLPLRLFPETKVLFPIRDPRDICISYFFTIIPLNASASTRSTLPPPVSSARTPSGCGVIGEKCSRARNSRRVTNNSSPIHRERCAACWSSLASHGMSACCAFTNAVSAKACARRPMPTSPNRSTRAPSVAGRIT